MVLLTVFLKKKEGSSPALQQLQLHEQLHVLSALEISFSWFPSDTCDPFQPAV